MARVTSHDVMSPREQRKLRHQDLARGQFLDAAEEVFGRKGFHETTLREIAELAEFSVGSTYSFFENKDDLFRQIFVRRGGEFMPELRAVLDPDGDPRQQLRALVEFEVGFFRRHRHFGRLYLKNANAALLPTDKAADVTMAANFEEAMGLQAGLFRRGQTTGVFREGDPAVLARLFSGIISSYQALDPLVISDEPRPTERFSLEELHAVIEAAFVVN